MTLQKTVINSCILQRQSFHNNSLFKDFCVCPYEGETDFEGSVKRTANKSKECIFTIVTDAIMSSHQRQHISACKFALSIIPTT